LTLKLPVQLTYSFQRAKDAETKRVTEANAAVGTQAQIYCQQTIPNGFSGRVRIGCIEEYTASHGVKENPVREELYKFNFASPTWSPDLAGWSIVIACVFGLFSVLQVLVRLFQKMLEKQHVHHM
jgi:hypothetical protein